MKKTQKCKQTFKLDQTKKRTERQNSSIYTHNYLQSLFLNSNEPIVTKGNDIEKKE